MTTENKLPQLVNTVEIVGTLKELNLEEKVSAKGNKYVRGVVTIVSEAADRVHEHKVSVMVMATSKLYKGIQTMMKEYKSIEAVGQENADRIKVIGEVDLEEYYGKDGTLISYNKIKGVFFNRLEENDATPDKAIASIEVVVKSFSPAVDTETGEITHHNVNCFTVGYNERIVELKKAIVSDQLHDAMANLYETNSTGRLTFKLNSYAEKLEREQIEQVSMNHGFGTEESVQTNRTIDKVTRNLEITGGDIPFEEPKALSLEQIEQAARLRNLALEELKNSNANRAASTPPTSNKPTGFGDIDSQMPTGMTGPATPPPVAPPTTVSDDDMPDF